jgi:L-ascorbate metabolism protein UlaG (beta-lactamase superfamily)
MYRLHRIYPYYNRGRFANYPGEKHRTVFWHSMIMLVQILLQKKRGFDRLKEWQLPVPTTPLLETDLPTVTWIGHATFLIRLQGLTIITDPIFGDLSFLFPRLTYPGVGFHNLPSIDIVLLSHNHPDHMDASTLYALEKRYSPLFLVPQGDKAWFDRRGFKRVRECMWWDQHEFDPNLSHGKFGKPIVFTFLPALHWSQRGIFDRNKSLWGSWMIESREVPYTVYFAGDTGYGQHFNAISREFPTIDLALMPIGPCEPQAWMRVSHIHPEEAGQAFLDLNAIRFIPMHWGTYCLGLEYPLEPLDRLRTWWQGHTSLLAMRHLHLMKFGQSLDCRASQHLILTQTESLYGNS